MPPKPLKAPKPPLSPVQKEIRRHVSAIDRMETELGEMIQRHNAEQDAMKLRIATKRTVLHALRQAKSEQTS